ncbi:hypothetical protein GOP47_0015918 [Adiantum capillus-veneris]|uniref:Uncharacterized protein n=1 Tax=Adiantum capillus-veneris TaxID=13818 RepID=A0A9D4UKW1_ADICA|nr:hypothetical protein GOP47_0015918 [Adiantum capillus-veneris]
MQGVVIRKELQSLTEGTPISSGECIDASPAACTSSPPHKRSKQELHKPHKPGAGTLFHLNDSVNSAHEHDYCKSKQAVVEPINIKKEAYVETVVPPHALNEARPLHIEPLSIEPPRPLQATNVPNPIEIPLNNTNDPSLIEIELSVQPSGLYGVGESSQVDSKAIDLSIVPFPQSLLPQFLITDISDSSP